MNDERDAAAVRVFPPAVPVVTILLGIALQRIWPIQVDLGITPAARYWLGVLIVIGANLGLGLWSVVLFRRSEIGRKPMEGHPPDRGGRAVPDHS